MRTVLLALGFLAAASPALAKGFCTGERDCPLTVGVLEASKSWRHCVYDSMVVQIKHTDDVNAAAEAALTACKAEEDAMIAKMEIETHLRPDEAVPATRI